MIAVNCSDQLWKLRFAILTRDANASMIEVHDRMPIIIGREAVRPYLTEYETAIGLISAKE